MREGDTLVVWKLDRLARSLKQLIETVETIGEYGIGLRSLTEAIDTTTAGGRLVFHLFAALAEFERGVIRERTLAGLQAARARGRTGWQAPCPRGQGHRRRQGHAAGPRDHRGRGRQAAGRGCLHPLPPFAEGPYRGLGRLSWSPPMPIKPELRWFYPIDWPQISRWVRFVRANGHCQVCGRPHGAVVRHLGDGRWWDEQRQIWRDGGGRGVPSPALAEDAPSERPRSCWRQRISTTTPRIAGVGIATSKRCAPNTAAITAGRSPIATTLLPTKDATISVVRL